MRGLFGREDRPLGTGLSQLKDGKIAANDFVAALGFFGGGNQHQVPNMIFGDDFVFFFEVYSKERLDRKSVV